jgi:hypothetical protein
MAVPEACVVWPIRIGLLTVTEIEDVVVEGAVG